MNIHPYYGRNCQGNVACAIFCLEIMDFFRQLSLWAIEILKSEKLNKAFVPKHHGHPVVELDSDYCTNQVDSPLTIRKFILADFGTFLLNNLGLNVPTLSRGCSTEY